MQTGGLTSRLRHEGRSLRAGLSRCKPLLIPTAVLSGVYILGICAILRANYNYIDDMGRVFEGYRLWENFGRYLSNFLSVFIHADSYLSDISPLPQLIACVLLALASVLVLRLITGRTRFTLWEYAAVLPLGLSPYMLECLSYKFDAPYMALSVLVSVLPLLLLDRAGWKRLGLSAFLCALVMCCTYQASAGIMPMLTALLALKMWLAGRSVRDLLRPVGTTAAGYCAGVLVFKVLILPHAATDTQNYVGTGMPPIGRLIPTALDHFKTYFQAIWTDFTGLWLVLLGLLLVLFLWAAVQGAARKKLPALLLALAAAAFLVLFSFGLFPLIEQPVFAGRSMYGLGACIAFLGVFAVSAKKALPAKLTCLVLAWCFFVFGFTYGNALSVQKTYTEFRTEEVLDSLKTMDAFESGGVLAQVEGTCGHAPAIRNAIGAFPVLDRLVPVTLRGDWVWGRYTLQNYYGLPSFAAIDPSTPGNALDLTKMDLPVLDETIYHTIRGRDNFLLIEIK